MSELVDRLHRRVDYFEEDTLAKDALEHIERLELQNMRLETEVSEASRYVESVIVMRTGFTGNPPYVGWKGLGLALTEYLDELEQQLAEKKRHE